MNALGLMLLSSIAHATVFALLGILVYLAIRRYSPAAGALAASASMATMVMVSLIVLGPWPRWWILAAHESAGAPASARAAEDADVRRRLPAEGDSAPRSIDSAPKRPTVASAVEEPSTIGRFVGELSRELGRSARVGDRARWGWPEWVALGFLVSLCLGLARLGLGMLAVRRLRALSLPIDDRELGQEIELLKKQLSCIRTVEVRETIELATPATIGWRRPLLLLPCDWRDWSASERRLVLAHELAHVCRGDFLAGLAAQLSLALHFYNPLAHWLAARLRLEQELAADAWGAFIAGGRASYLETLAQMALRRDNRVLSWPARAFLPSRDTFVRRIEMLRSTDRIRNVSLPALARAGTVGILAALGLLVAGLRGPGGTTAAQAQEPTQIPSATPRPNSGAPANDVAINLTLLPADTKMLIAARPRILLRHSEFRAMLSQITQDPSRKALRDLHPEQVEELVVFWEGSPEPAQGGQEPLITTPSGVVVRMSKSQDWKPIVSQLVNSPQEISHAGQLYYRPNGRLPGAWSAFTPDDRTLVSAREDLLRELIEDRKAPAPRRAWDEAWNKVAKGQVMLALETRWLRRRLARELQAGAPGQAPASALGLKVDIIAPLVEKAQSYAISIDASQGLSVDLVAATGSDENMKPVAETMQALLTLGKNAVDGVRHEAPGQTQAMDWTLQAALALLSQARVESSSGFVHMHAKSSIELTEGLKFLTPAVTAMSENAGRAQSMVNLKQIGLAFHNYHATNEHFPPPVLYGGQNKSIPYSWRVAILPFIEQDALYREYNFDEPWDGPNNRKLLEKMPPIYNVHGSNGGPARVTTSSYFVLTGPTTAVGAAGRTEKEAQGSTIMQITDGTSNTILAVERRSEVPWTKPEDIPFDPSGPLPELGGFWPDGFNAAFADGSVRFISKTIHPQVLKALITRAGGEVISTESLEAPPR